VPTYQRTRCFTAEERNCKPQSDENLKSLVRRRRQYVPLKHRYLLSNYTASHPARLNSDTHRLGKVKSLSFFRIFLQHLLTTAEIVGAYFAIIHDSFFPVLSSSACIIPSYLIQR
jgi:hypothetical protein